MDARSEQRRLVVHAAVIEHRDLGNKAEGTVKKSD